jgi:hypothetical protein
MLMIDSLTDKKDGNEGVVGYEGDTGQSYGGSPPRIHEEKLMDGIKLGHLTCFNEQVAREDPKEAVQEH